MTPYRIFIYFIIVLKVLFLLCLLTTLFLKHKIKKGGDPKDVAKDVVEMEKYSKMKNTFEFAFQVCMSGVIIYHFYPKWNIRPTIDFETGLLIFVYGIIVLLGLNWGSPSE